jgi:hypothetical protein
MLTDAPTAPLLGVRVVMLGGETTVKTVLAPVLLETPDTVTTTFPVVVALGTVVVMLVAVQFPAATVAVLPLNLTVLVPCVEPKLVPVITTVAPIAPVAGDKLVIVGVATTVNTVLAFVALSTPLA